MEVEAWELKPQQSQLPAAAAPLAAEAEGAERIVAQAPEPPGEPPFESALAEREA